MCVITIIINNQYIAVWLPVGVELILQIQWVIINSSFCVQIHVKIKLKIIAYRLLKKKIRARTDFLLHNIVLNTMYA